MAVSRGVLPRKPRPQARAASSFSALSVIPRGNAASLAARRVSNYFGVLAPRSACPDRTGHESSAFGPHVLSTIRLPVNPSSSGRHVAPGKAGWAEPGAQGFLPRVLGTSSSWVPLGHVGALGLRPHNPSLQRTRVPSSRFLKLCGSPLNSISLDALTWSQSQVKLEHQRALKRLADAIAGRDSTAEGEASVPSPPPADSDSHPNGYRNHKSGGSILLSLVGGLAALLAAQLLVWWLFPSSVPGAGAVWWQTFLGGLLSIRVGYMAGRLISRRNSAIASRA